MNNSLILSTLNSALPSLSAKGLTYNDIAKMFLTPLWISQAGNAYQQGLRFSDRIVNSSHRIILKGESLRKGKISTTE